MLTAKDNSIEFSAAELKKPTVATSKELIETSELLCKHCKRTESNGIRCLGMCVADSEY